MSDDLHAEALDADAVVLAAQAGALAVAMVDADVLGDFAAVVARSAELSDRVGTPQDLETAEALVARDDAALAGAINFGTLDDFLDDASAFVTQQHVDALPPVPAPSQPVSRRRWWVGLGVALSAAAAVLLVSWAGVGVWSADRVDADGSGEFASAIDHAQMAETGGHSRNREPTPRPRRPAPAPDTRSTLAPEPDLESESESEPESEPDSPPAKSAPRRTKQQRLQDLDAQARAAWKAGDLATAQRKLESLVRAGGTRNIADIAYGDLFSLARQRGQTKALRAHWRRYATTFAKGRYIDDARAGLCRTASADARRGCWQAYLRDRPRGTYHQHARDLLDRTE